MSDQKDLSTLLAELDAAVAKMTPGPWRAFVRDIEQMSDGGKGYPLNVYPDCATVHVGHPTVDDERTGNVGLRRQEDIDGIVALVNAYPALREAIEQAIKTQQHMDETLRPLVEELRKAAHQARARETEACAEAARLRTECDEQAAIASNAVTKGAAYALENERLRALVAQQREALRGVIAIVESKAIRGLAAFAFVHGYKPCSDEETERNIKTLDEARAVLAAEVPGA